MKLTKAKIEELVFEIEEFLKGHDFIGDVCIYFNDKRHAWRGKYDEKWNFDGYVCDIRENISPLDYFEYANPEHILSMSFEGSFYDVMNGYTSFHFDLQDKFSELLKKYSLYYELGNAWNLSCYPTDDDMEIEYTDYSNEVKPEPEFIYLGKADVLPELKNIMIAWHEMSKLTGDQGCCVVGACMKFDYNGKTYEMAACSPWQGENSWTPHVTTIKLMLGNIGATNIKWDCGRMD
jgi:hypothetical protein